MYVLVFDRCIFPISGLKDLADFLPASLATIVSYFSAEVTRGIWKLASMNGTDWPSPAANLATVEQQIKKILAATGVNVPSLTVGKHLSKLKRLHSQGLKCGVRNLLPASRLSAIFSPYLLVWHLLDIPVISGDNFSMGGWKCPLSLSCYHMWEVQIIGFDPCTFREPSYAS